MDLLEVIPSPAYLVYQDFDALDAEFEASTVKVEHDEAAIDEESIASPRTKATEVVSSGGHAQGRHLREREKNRIKAQKNGNYN